MIELLLCSSTMSALLCFFSRSLGKKFHVLHHRLRLRSWNRRVCFLAFNKTPGLFPSPLNSIQLFWHLMIPHVDVDGHKTKPQQVLIEETLYPILERTCWSLNIALHGRRPQPSLEDPFRVKVNLAGLPLSKTFALVEFKADWKFHVEFWGLWSHYWKSGCICHLCQAARIPRQVYQTLVKPNVVDMVLANL